MRPDELAVEAVVTVDQVDAEEPAEPAVTSGWNGSVKPVGPAVVDDELSWKLVGAALAEPVGAALKVCADGVDDCQLESVA